MNNSMLALLQPATPLPKNSLENTLSQLQSFILDEETKNHSTSFCERPNCPGDSSILKDLSSNNNNSSSSYQQYPTVVRFTQEDSECLIRCAETLLDRIVESVPYISEMAKIHTDQVLETDLLELVHTERTLKEEAINILETELFELRATVNPLKQRIDELEAISREYSLSKEENKITINKLENEILFLKQQANITSIDRSNYAKKILELEHQLRESQQLNEKMRRKFDAQKKAFGNKIIQLKHNINMAESELDEFVEQYKIVLDYLTQNQDCLPNAELLKSILQNQ